MIAAAFILAFWPLLAWYYQRMVDPSDPSWGLLALAALLFLLAEKREGESRPLEFDFRWPVAGLTTYLLTCFWLPNLLLSAVAIFSLVSVLSQKRFGIPVHLGALGLGLLALPIISSLQFYLGYPLRVLVARGAAILIQGNKLPVQAEGAGINLAGNVVLVDAPCSGINMLWVALFLACVLSIVEKLGNKQTTIFLSGALICTVGANIIRAASLFYLETDIIQGPSWSHTFVGISTFAVLVVALVTASKCVTGKPDRPRESHAKGKAPFLALCALAAIAPLFQPSTVSSESTNFPGWPNSFEGSKLQQLPLTQEESKFYSDFPGKVARFTSENREIIIRWVTQPTRALHPSSDCFRGLGYDIGALKVKGDWRTFRASKDGRSFSVREQITGPTGKSWSDISAWYWSAALGQSEGPYWVTVVAERESMTSRQDYRP